MQLCNLIAAALSSLLLRLLAPVNVRCNKQAGNNTYSLNTPSQTSAAVPSPSSSQTSAASSSPSSQSSSSSTTTTPLPHLKLVLVPPVKIRLSKIMSQAIIPRSATPLNKNMALLGLIDPSAAQAVKDAYPPDGKLSENFDPARYQTFVKDLGGPQKLRNLLALGGFNDIPPPTNLNTFP